MLDVPFRSARQLAADIKKKKIGCLELLDLYLARVEKYDGALNAVVVRDFERARTRARAADRALAKRDVWGPLHEIGRASCRERVQRSLVGGSPEHKTGSGSRHI